MTAAHSVVQTRRLNAAIEDVWDAWTDPNLMKQWFCPLGMKAAEVEADLKVGGKFRVVMDPMDADIPRPPGVGKLLIAHGAYQVIDPLSKLVFSWAWEGRTEQSRVSVTIKQVDDVTELRLVHDGLETEDCRVFHEDGWIPTLENLTRYLSASQLAIEVCDEVV